MTDRRYTYQMCECGNPDCSGCEESLGEQYEDFTDANLELDTEEYDDPNNPYSEQHRELWDEPQATKHGQDPNVDVTSSVSRPATYDTSRSNRNES